MKNIDISIERRKYYRKGSGLEHCPECHSALVKEGFPIILAVKTETERAIFMTSLSGSHFCNNCPVVVFDSKTLEKAAKFGLRTSQNFSYAVGGFVDLDLVPEEKRSLQLGTDENPTPVVPFLPGLDAKPSLVEKKASIIKRRILEPAKKLGRNQACHCGSGKKYKKCCLKADMDAQFG